MQTIMLTPTKQTNKNKQVAGTILQQLGGRRFMMMTGTKPKYCGDENGLSYVMLQLARNASGAKYLKITLDVMEVYTMEFIKEKRTKDTENSFPGYTAWNIDFVTVKEITGVYCDQLESIFEQTTELYTRL